VLGALLVATGPGRCSLYARFGQVPASHRRTP
jgi:hypothetical protein